MKQLSAETTDYTSEPALKLNIIENIYYLYF